MSSRPYELNKMDRKVLLQIPSSVICEAFSGCESIVSLTAEGETDRANGKWLQRAKFKHSRVREPYWLWRQNL